MLADAFHEFVRSTLNLNGAPLVIKNTFITVECNKSQCRARAKSAPAVVNYAETAPLTTQTTSVPSDRHTVVSHNKINCRPRSYTAGACASAAVTAALGPSVERPLDGDRSQNGYANGDCNQRTTVILRNLPHDYTRAMLLDTLTSCGFVAAINFLYLPMNFGTLTSFGYVFINFVTSADAQRFMVEFQGFYNWTQPCIVGRLAAHVEWSGERQGLHGQIERYRNSAMMHNTVVDEAKPILLSNGVRLPFPEPTQIVKPLRVRAWKMKQARCIDSSTEDTEGSSPRRPGGRHTD